ncbi:hypothetical protein ONZ45_g16209 [Pleurotus djamor]|nr:hypothetical protein ONZ45_g16209 [Pleurotus djamor]
MSFFQRLWRFVQTNKPARLIGRDLEGNTYYERFNPNNPTRAKRTVKYYAEQDMWRYIGGERRLAVQWTAWLSHTRAHPPTLEELELDAARVERVRHNAAMIEARERQEREEALRLGEGIPPAINDSDYQPTEPVAPLHIRSQGNAMPVRSLRLSTSGSGVDVPPKPQEARSLVQKARRHTRLFLTFVSFLNKSLRSMRGKFQAFHYTGAVKDGGSRRDDGRHEDKWTPASTISASRLPYGLELTTTSPICIQATSDASEAQDPATNSSPVDAQIISPQCQSPPAKIACMLSERYPEFWGIAPSLFKRYERARKIPRDYHDTIILPFFVDSCRDSPVGWIPFQHPEGALYFHCPRQNIYTDANLTDKTISDAVIRFAQRYEIFLHENHISLDSSVELVLDYEEEGEYEGTCGYYLVDHQRRSVFWLDEFKTEHLPDWNEVPGVTSQAHIRHELESQYWYHCELFPNTRELTQNMIDEIRDLITHALGDELQVILKTIKAAESQVGKTAPGSVCIISRFMHIRARHRFLNFHGEPPARLGRDQAIYNDPKRNQRSYLISLISPMLFNAPEVHLRTLNAVYVDEIVYAHGINKFIEKLNSEWQEFILYATVLLNANVALLAIQSVDGSGEGPKSPIQICSYMSIAMSVGSIILGLLLVRQNRTKGKDSAPEAAQFMRKHSLEILAILYSLPYALLMWAMLAFLSAFSFLCFDSTDLATRLVVMSVCLPIAILIVWCIWYTWESHGPNAWWESVFGALGGWMGFVVERCKMSVRGTSGTRPEESHDLGQPLQQVQAESGQVVAQSPRKVLRWAAFFGLKRRSIDSDKTTV